MPAKPSQLVRLLHAYRERREILCQAQPRLLIERISGLVSLLETLLS
jgi:hypothetical protein